MSDDPEGAGRRPPDWLDRTRYPFESQWVDLPAGRLHYVDEGEGRPVVLVHGNPTWSFLYRNLIAGLTDEYRCIAPDLLGFGRSEAPREFSYRPADQARAFGRFAERLDIGDAAFVVHDWGGPVALDYATRNPATVAGLVVMNTWMWPRDRVIDRALAHITNNLLAKRLIVRHNAFARAALVAAARPHGRQAPTVYRQYLTPLGARRRRYATWVFSHAVTGSRAWLDQLWRRREALTGTPVLLPWGRWDPIHGRFLDRWQSVFPGALTTVYDTGHFVPEEVGRDLVNSVAEFLARL